MQHTDIPTRSEIEVLATTREPGCVSIYLPTGSLPTEADVWKIELKNMLKDATDQLSAAGTDDQIIAAITSAVTDKVNDPTFWRYQSNSLALFVSGTSFYAYRVPNRLDSALEVSDRFYIKPLIRAVTFPQSAFILALAQNSVRLIEISAEGPANRMTVPDMPADVATAVGLESVKGRGPDGRIQGSEGQKVRMREYAQAIEAAIHPVLATSSRPLILAGAEPLTSIFRSVCTYPRMVEPVIAGNPEEKSDEQLASAARPLLDELYASVLADIKDRFGTSAAHGRAVVDLTDVARAATSKAIETLLVDIDQRIPGIVDEETGVVTLDNDNDASNYGVVDEILRRALLSDARVFAVRAEDVPGGGAVAATVRFPA